MWPSRSRNISSNGVQGNSSSVVAFGSRLVFINESAGAIRSSGRATAHSEVILRLAAQRGTPGPDNALAVRVPRKFPSPVLGSDPSQARLVVGIGPSRLTTKDHALETPGRNPLLTIHLAARWSWQVPGIPCFGCIKGLRNVRLDLFDSSSQPPACFRCPKGCGL
jgi:hypothetical protein